MRKFWLNLGHYRPSIIEIDIIRETKCFWHPVLVKTIIGWANWVPTRLDKESLLFDTAEEAYTYCKASVDLDKKKAIEDCDDILKTMEAEWNASMNS